jgi:hypothetical protein
MAGSGVYAENSISELSKTDYLALLERFSPGVVSAMQKKKDTRGDQPLCDGFKINLDRDALSQIRYVLI